MSETKIAIPETLQFYYKNSSNNEAINVIVDKEEPSRDSNWDELNEFYTSKLAAHKTQFDYWCFGNKLWKLIWEDKITRYDNCREIDMDDYQGENFINYIWNESDEFLREYHIGKYLLSVGVYIDFEDGIRLFALFLENDKGINISDGWDLKSPWVSTLEDEDGDYRFRWTETETFPIANKENLDLQSLNIAAEEVMGLIEIK